MLMPLVQEHRGPLSVAQACQALGLPPSTYHRWEQPPRAPTVRTSPRALAPQERQQVLAVLHAPRFVDRTPAHVVATLLDEQTYYCSERTMYRILAADSPTKERRNQAQRRRYARPQLCATGPNQLWSWDISKLALSAAERVRAEALARATPALKPPWQRRAWQPRRRRTARVPASPDRPLHRLRRSLRSGPFPMRCCPTVKGARRSR